jgi:hypothetical protein
MQPKKPATTPEAAAPAYGCHDDRRPTNPHHHAREAEAPHAPPAATGRRRSNTTSARGRRPGIPLLAAAPRVAPPWPAAVSRCPGRPWRTVDLGMEGPSPSSAARARVASPASRAGLPVPPHTRRRSPRRCASVEAPPRIHTRRSSAVARGPTTKSTGSWPPPLERKGPPPPRQGPAAAEKRQRGERHLRRLGFPSPGRGLFWQRSFRCSSMFHSKKRCSSMWRLKCNCISKSCTHFSNGHSTP